MSPNEARVMVHLETHGPQTLNDLLGLPRLNVKNLNDILESLLAAGQIERCAIGVQGDVRALEKAGQSEDKTYTGVPENLF